MGKRRREAEEEPQEAPVAEEVAAAAEPAEEQAGAEAAPADNAAQFGDGEGEGGGRGFGRRNRSVVNPETVAYLEEVVTHFKTLVDDEERSLLVGNVLEEIAGKEVKVAGDPVCSRHVETLMAAAQAGQLLRFITSVSDVDGFFTLVSSPFGSHVVEKLLVRLESQLDSMSQEEFDEFQKVLTLLFEAVAPHLYDYATDRFATHVVRRLLCAAAGRNVLPPAVKSAAAAAQQQLPGLSNKRAKTEDAPAGGLASRLGPGAGGAGAGGASALAAELLGAGANEPPPARFPDLLSKLVDVVCSDDYAGATVGELVYHPYACPLLQALLKAAASDRKALRQLVPVLLGSTVIDDRSKGGAGAVLGGCKEEEVVALLTDPTTSHLAEVMLQVLPAPILEEFHRRFLAPRLAELAQHPSANFVVQAALAAAPSKEVAKSQFEGLQGLLSDLLTRRRGGVVAALAAALGWHGVCQKEMCAALASALGSMPSPAGLKGDAALAPALLCLDSFASVGANEPYSAATRAAGGAQRLSPVGCSILIQVLRYGQGACRAFTDSVAALQPNDAARVGADPSGSRVLEALLGGNAPAKVKAQLLGALAGRWEAVATTGSGAFLVESAYRLGDAPAKEAIVSRLASAEKALEGCHWGPALMRKVGVEAYKRDPEQWRRHAASSTKTLDAFAAMFGAGTGAGGDKGGKGGKGKGKERGAGKGEDGGGRGGQHAEAGEPEAPAPGDKGAEEEEPQEEAQEDAEGRTPEEERRAARKAAKKQRREGGAAKEEGGKKAKRKRAAEAEDEEAGAGAGAAAEQAGPSGAPAEAEAAQEEGPRKKRKKGKGERAQADEPAPEQPGPSGRQGDGGGGGERTKGKRKGAEEGAEEAGAEEAVGTKGKKRKGDGGGKDETKRAADDGEETEDEEGGIVLIAPKAGKAKRARQA
ncbi:hypothetical protein HYH03_002483 [Edaphochlamys debaryana]|uniref:Uncharacterized protein n=1 Tax=Edaphochlamys debaryana TaxID=47281 RepID=A0A835YDD0_9CHLO|nr:hypothetical protein HYH03_002483 [Edaphochlamys debaryana]|eukprot:KAG2499537.1 hypothetical protein HYH03_002483 [Edaphochlamys debaryana]